jgi:xanthine dehydrogenase accessory factor
VTGGCVEPAVYDEAREVLAGGPPRLVTYGIADEEAFEVGLPCGGTVHIFVDLAERDIVEGIAAAVREERPVALEVRVAGERIGEKRLVPNGAVSETGLASDELFVSSFLPRPEMYVFGAVDHAAAVARVGRFLGYRVTVCDARAKFVTPERFPDVDELVVEWPDRFLAQAPVDERTVICVLTHDHKFDIPLLKVALETPAGYIGAMGARRTNAERAERLREEGVFEEALERVHAPIGLDIGSRTPEEVAVAVAAEIVQTFRKAPVPA